MQVQYPKWSFHHLIQTLLDGNYASLLYKTRILLSVPYLLYASAWPTPDLLGTVKLGRWQNTGISVSNQLLSSTLRMRLLLLLLSVAFCCGFTVTDLLIPENAADRQFDVEDQILPVFLITFIGALLNNILNFGGQETNVQGTSFIYILLLGCFIHWFANVFYSCFDNWWLWKQPPKVWNYENECWNLHSINREILYPP